MNGSRSKGLSENQIFNSLCHMILEWYPNAQFFWQNVNFVITNKKLLKNRDLNFSRSALFHMETRVSLKYFVNGCLWKHIITSNSPQTPSNLISLTILVTLRSFTVLT